MTRPATLPELLAQGKVKPGDWVECVENRSRWYSAGGRYEVCQHGMANGVRENLSTFRPVKPAKAKKWGEWEVTQGTNMLEDYVESGQAMQVKCTKGGSLMIRYRRKG